MRPIVLTMRLLFLDTGRSPNERPCPSRAVYELPIQPAITTVSAQDAGQRQLCVSYICQQRSYRLRHQTPTADLANVRKVLQRRKALVAHTIYECSGCGERFLGERRCGDCNLFARAVGVGGACPECDAPVLLEDLVGEEVVATT